MGGSLADKFGRLFAMRLTAVPFTAWDLSGWRLVGGVAVGMASVIAPAYIAEIAPAEPHGRLGPLPQPAIVLGIALSQVVNWAIAAAAAEPAPSNRARAAARAAQWSTNWLVTGSFPSLSDLSLSGAFAGCTAFAASSIYFGWKWIPETKGRTLEKMS